MTTIDIDGLSEEEFRRSIESRMRQGLSGKAVEKLRALLAPFAGPGGILPERFLTVEASDLSLGGWDALGDALRRHDRPGRPVTALSITFGWPGDDVPQPDEEGRLSPLIETSYYTDDAFPFSQSSREDMLEGYSYHGCTWTGDYEATDTALWLTGVDDLHGALALLEAQLLASDDPDVAGICAGSLGACLLSVLLFQTVEARIAQGALPRPLCVMAGSNGVYPYFDAPVAGFPEDARKAAEAAEDEAVVDAGVPGPRYSSLLVAGIPRAKKRAVLVLAETADEEAVRIARLREIAHAEAHAATAAALPEPPLRSDGTIASAPESPLLVKKPAGQSWDFREMLSPYEADGAASETEPLVPEDDWDEAESVEPEQAWGSGPPSEPEPEPDWGGSPPSEPEPDRDDAAPLELEAESQASASEPLETEQAWDRPAPIEPTEAPLPAMSGSAAIVPIGPGFSLLESLREERQQPLFPLPDFHIVEDDAEEPAVPIEAILELEPEPEPELEPVLPFEAEAAPEPEPVALAEFEPTVEPEPEPVSRVAPESEPVMAAVAEPPPPAWPPDPAWLREVEARILPRTPNSETAVPRQANAERVVTKSLLERLSDWWNGRR